MCIQLIKHNLFKIVTVEIEVMSHIANISAITTGVCLIIVCDCASVCLSVCLCLCLSICVCLCLCVHICLSLCASVCVSVCICLCFHLCVCLCICMRSCLCICECVCVSVILFAGLISSFTNEVHLRMLSPSYLNLPVMMNGSRLSISLKEEKKTSSQLINYWIKP